MAALTLEGVVKHFGTHPVIHDIDLAVEDGEFVVLVGPSGCGKSTLLRIIAGLESTSAGKVSIGHVDVTSLQPGDRGVAMVFQSYALYPHMTVRQNLSFGLENQPMAKAEIDRRVDEAARMLAIEPLIDRRPKQLSGGQRQRVAIGRAIVRDPKIFLFDEPLSNLDAALRVQTRGEISRLHRRLGATMVYVTHDQIEAMTMADRIAVLNAGRLEQFGPPLDLFERPVNKFVAGFIGSPRMNFFDGRISSVAPAGIGVDLPGLGEITVAARGAGAAVDQPVTLGIRPNHFHFVRHTDDAGLRLDLDVAYSESVGTETFLFGRIPGNTTDVVLHLPDHVPAREGERMHFTVEPARLHLFDARTELAFEKA